jgi:UDP-glucose 4-epimerase
MDARQEIQADRFWSDRTDCFQGKNVLILGGLGFIGSSLAIRLASMGARLLLVDSMLDEYGGNTFNIAPVKDQVQVNYCDIRDERAMAQLVRDQDYIFHGAAQVCHLKSLCDPFPDIDINIRGTAVLLEALRKFNPTAKLVKLGSRGQYGPVARVPASEDDRSDPKGIYEISLLTAEQIIRSYHRNHGIESVLTRLTNIYGPRAQMRHNRYGVANWFLRLAIDGQTIPVFGDGLIKRDFLYIDDCVEALLRLAVTPQAVGQVVNVGDEVPSNFLELAQTIVRATGTAYALTPFSAERKAQEPGDFYSDITKIRRLTGWRPRCSLEEGVRRTLEFYLANKGHYW